MHITTTIPSLTARGLAIAGIVTLAVIWILGMSGVIQLPLALVWILPFICLVAGALIILWEGGAFDTR
ncbi:MAG TPA: hypothetical protein VKX16_07540 [Chloroflexota bacterium]|nr:hypothetical protein [Chloroflexota bacterium]